jgi:long-chain acyl-CoA synthetase
MTVECGVRTSPNLADDLFARATAQPDQPAILGPHTEQVLSYGALAAQIRSLAGKLLEAGVRPGMNIGLHYPSGGTYIAYTYAIWAAGACVTPIPAELAGPEKRLIQRRIALDAIVTSRRGHEPLMEEAGRIGGELPDDALLLSATRLRTPPPGLAALDPAFIRFTSGTTGTAKGVVLSHATIRARIAAANAVLAIGPADRVVWLLSMAYHFAVSIVAYLSYGAGIVLPANAFGVSIRKAANTHDATLIYGAPTHYELMTHETDGRLPGGLRLAIVTAARLRPELARRFRARFGIALNETYGIIEAGLVAINHDRAWEHPGSVGRALPAYTLKLGTPSGRSADHDPDTGGGREILLRGPGLLDAYYDPWRPRSEILTEGGGWLATGDLGRIDADGYLTLIGRTKDLISVGGMKFFPQEVETVLEQHPDIAEACVYGMPHPRDGERPWADLTLAASTTSAPDAAVLERHCRPMLAPYKVPHRFRIVAALPRTASGKLLRRGQRPPSIARTAPSVANNAD